VSRFDITRRLRAAVDRSEDPHLLIDMVREEQQEHVERLATLERDVKLLQDAERKRVTDSGVWRIVKGKLEEETIDWFRWAIRGTLGAVGVLIITALFRLVWKYT
jgi:hypothetical protein